LAAGGGTTTIGAMKFCPSCAAPVVQCVPEGDHLRRDVCTACGAIHYRNPKLIAGCVPEHEGRILICRRAIEPRRGYWTVPAGFMDAPPAPLPGDRPSLPPIGCAPRLHAHARLRGGPGAHAA
jgi:hypothetical protein